jgi:AcrR family transcriptional regulator
MRRPPRRTNDPDGTRRNIVEVATLEFAHKGYSGARVDAIAARTRTSKRMLYYYFGSKEGLYLAVLEEAYGSIRREEATLALDSLPPEQALRTLVESTFDYYTKHPEFVRLVMNENIMGGVHMARSKTISKLNVTVIDATRRLIERGQKERLFPPRHRPDRAAHVDQRARHLQRRQPRHLLDHLQARHDLAQGAQGAARGGRRDHPGPRPPGLT